MISIFAIVVPIVVAVVALYFAHKDLFVAHHDAVAARTMARDDVVAAKNLAHDSFRISLMSSHNDVMGQLILAGFNLCYIYAVCNHHFI